jgi:hypothetical protein
MNRSERARMARLDSTLRRLDDAEKTALFEIRNAGFPVRNITEARTLQAEYQEAARVHAHAVERMSELARGRKTA